MHVRCGVSELGIPLIINGESAERLHGEMRSSALVSAIQKPLIWLIVIAATLLTLLALETTGASGHAPSLVPLSQVAHASTADNSHGHGHGKGGNKAHCSDGHGKDNNKNKHCQISGSG